jgi:hypothetical protein
MEKVEDENSWNMLYLKQDGWAWFEVGEDVSEEVGVIELGRRAILALRQKLNFKNTRTRQYKSLQAI